MGKPSTYTDEIAAEICRRLSKGEPLEWILKDDHMPGGSSTVSDWRKAHPDFATAYDQARQDGFDAIAADCLRIADTPLEGVVEKLEMVDVPNPNDANAPTRELRVVERRREDMLGHRKLQVDTRLKLLAKWDPSRYGERLHTEHSGEVVVHRKVFRTGDDDPAAGDPAPVE